MNAGSFFLAEIVRTMSSFRPRGMDSDSMSVTKPYWYSLLASSWMVLVEVLMVLLNVRLKGRNGNKAGFAAEARRQIRTVLLTHFFDRQVSKPLCHDLVEALQRAFHIALLKLPAQAVVRYTVGQ